MSAVRPCLAVIPARGGSKGLPGKNIRPFAGLPLLVHSYRCARLVDGIDRVILSTDSDEIAAVARAAGLEVPFRRPPELAGDTTPMMPVVTHALAEMERQTGRGFATVLLLDPTSPGRLPGDVTRAFELLAADPLADGVVACSQPTFNPFWVGVVERDGYLAPAFGDGESYQRRQDVPVFHRINGSLYLWRSELVRSAPTDWRRGRRHLRLDIPEARAFSIDNQYEFDLAETLFRGGLLQFPWLEER